MPTSRPTTTATYNTHMDAFTSISSRPHTAEYDLVSPIKKNNKKNDSYTSSSSIPSRYPERKAKRRFKKPSFGSSGKRFECTTTSLPGPGYYSADNVATTSLLAEGPSFPKGGFGNAFLSKVKKLSLIGGIYEIPGCRNKPGPGEYYQPREPDGRDIKFTKSGKGRVPYPDPPITPSSFDYYPELPQTPKLLRRKESATFCSETVKIPDPYMTDAPGIGKYSLPDDIAHINSFAWSKSTHKRFGDFGKDNRVPSPTHYFSDEPMIIDNRRLVGNFKGPYKGKQNETPSAALHTCNIHTIITIIIIIITIILVGADKDRFKHSFCGRLDLKALEPGPGEYRLPDFAKEVF